MSSSSSSAETRSGSSSGSSGGSTTETSSTSTTSAESSRSSRARSRLGIYASLIFIGLFLVYWLGFVWARGYTMLYIVYIATGRNDLGNLGLAMTLGFALGGTETYRYGKERLRISLEAYRRLKLAEEERATGDE